MRRLLTILLLFGGTAFAQSATAVLSGTVVDEQQGRVASAAVTLLDDATGFKRVTTTSAEGYFVFQNLPAASYKLNVTKQGFANTDLSDVVLNVNDQRMLRVEMRVAGTAERVVVAAQADLIDESPVVATSVDRTFIENQPLNGRSFQTLLQLVPGLVFTKTGVGSMGQFSVNGQRASTNNLQVDGVSGNVGISNAATLYESAGGNIPAYTTLGSTASLASVDAVQEFTVQTSSYAPEFGRQPGAQVSVVTRSGTNEFHGSAFDYFRNEAMDANDWFANRNRIGRIALRQNDYGFVLGGPVLLPRYDGRNKTFFFVSYEGLRLTQPQISNPLVVPDIASRQAASGVMRDILNSFPLPNGPAAATDPNGATFIGGAPNRSELNATSFRIDQAVASRLSLFGRFSHSPSSGHSRDFSGGGANVLVDRFTQTDTLTIGSTLRASGRLFNDLRLNYSRSNAGVGYQLDGFGGATPLSNEFLFPSYTGPATGLTLIFLGSTSLSAGTNSDNVQRQWNIVDTASLTTGTHSWKFGVDVRRLTPEVRGATFRRFFFFTTVAQIAAGVVPSGSLGLTDIQLFPQYLNLSAFAQDTWKISERLTLTYGLRYELNPSPSERNGHLAFTLANTDDPARLALAPLGTKFYETDKWNFAPRLGISWRPFLAHGLVLRGGAGMFYDLGYTFVGSSFVTNVIPYGRTVTFANTPLNSPTIAAAPPPFNPNPTPPVTNVTGYAPGYSLPYTVQYNVALEQPLGRENSLTITYAGAAGRDLGRAERLRNPNPNFTLVTIVRNAARSDYHALQLQFQRRLARGLQALASYAWSHSIDTVSDESIVNYQAPLRVMNPNNDRGSSDFDVRHSASATVSYQLGQRVSPAAWLNRIVGGFGLDSVLVFRSAFPVNIITGTDPLGLGFTTLARPNVVPEAPVYMDDALASGGRKISRAAFVSAPAGVQGNLGRNVFRGFQAVQYDLSVRRVFRLTERANLQFRVDAYNLFNHPNFADPIASLANVNFGLSTQMLSRNLGGISPIYAAGGPRSLQLALKVQF